MYILGRRRKENKSFEYKFNRRLSISECEQNRFVHAIEITAEREKWIEMKQKWLDLSVEWWTFFNLVSSTSTAAAAAAGVGARGRRGKTLVVCSRATNSLITINRLASIY